jgi:hypothetical protein
MADYPHVNRNTNRFVVSLAQHSESCLVAQCSADRPARVPFRGPDLVLPSWCLELRVV